MTFKQGKPQGSLKKVGPARGSGTTVFFKPDPQIFPKVEFDAALIRERDWARVPESTGIWWRRHSGTIA